METQTTNLRQAENKITVVGILAEKDLHEGKNQTNGKKTIEGYVSIKVDDINQVRLNVRVDETKKDGTSNPAYENLTKFNQDTQSIAEVGEESASKVATYSAQLNPYHSTQSGKDTLGYRTSFIGLNRETEDGQPKWDPRAEGEVEVFIQSIMPEMDREGEETGRAIIKGIMPTYNGVEPIILIAPAEDGFADSVLNGYEPGQTVQFFYTIKNSVVEVKKEIPVKLGKPRYEISRTYTNELILTGGSEPYEEEATAEHPACYDSSAIKLALQEREEKIKEAANKPKGNSAPTQSKPSGAAKGRVPQGW